MSDGTITVANLFGRTVTIENDGITSVKDALNIFYGGSGNVPSTCKVQISGKDVTHRTAVRACDVLIVREGEFANKKAVSGATS